MVDSIAIFALNLLGAVAKKINGGSGKRLAGDRIRNVIEHLFVEGLFYDHRVADPDYHAGGIAVLHLCRQQVGTGPGQGLRKFDGDTPIPVSFIRVQLQVPVRRFLADVSGLIFTDQPLADIVNLHLLTVQPPRIGANIGFYILNKRFDPDAVGF